MITMLKSAVHRGQCERDVRRDRWVQVPEPDLLEWHRGRLWHTLLLAGVACRLNITLPRVAARLTAATPCGGLPHA